MKRVLLFLFLLLALGWASNAQAQCSGNYSAGQFCGSAGGGLPGPVSISGFAGTAINIMAAPYNAKCDGVTDDTAAIAAAIAATPSGGTLALPNGLPCIIKGASTAIFTLTKPINIIGQGMTEDAGETGSSLVLDASVPTSRDVFHIVGITNQTLAGFTFRNFNVIAQGTSGKNVLHFDSTAGTTTNFANILIDNVYFQNLASAGGSSIFLNNGTGTNTNGGAYTVTISNSFLGGGFNTSKTGDSIRVINNLISTANAGVTLDQVAGAGGFYASGNNISGAAGCFVVTQAIKPVWGSGNECEQQVTNTEANNAIIDIVATGTVSGALISGGQIQANTGTGSPTLIRNAGADTVIENMRLATPTAYAHIINVAAAARLVIGADNAFSGGGANITDSTSPLNTIYGPLLKGTPLGVLGNISSTVTQPYTDIIPNAVDQALVVDHIGASIGFGPVRLLGVATGASLALGGATIGGNALAVMGTTLHSGAVTVSGASFGLSGNQSLAAWTTRGARYANVAGTLTDTTSSGTVAAVYDSVFGGNTIAASSATTYTLAVGSYFKAPVAGTNATFTANYALGADSIYSGGPVSLNGVETIQSGGNIGFGTETNPQALFVFSANTTTGIAAAVNNSVIFNLATGAAGGYATQSFAGVPQNSFVRADGTAASPAIIGGAETIGNLIYKGFNGSTYSTTANISAASTGAWTNGSNYGTYIEFDTTPASSTTKAQAGRFMAGFIVGTGTTDPGAGQLAVTAMTQTSAAQSGTICYSTTIGAVTYDATLGCLTSLEELKDIHGPITGALAEVEKMKPFWFSPINRPAGSDVAEQPGFGAHQIEGVDKRLVGYDEHGNLRGVRYMEMTAVLAAAIQELKADNDNLKMEIKIIRRTAR